MQDRVDRRIARWRRELPELDWLAEGIAARIYLIHRELSRHKRASLARHGLQVGQWQTLRDLRGMGEPYRATPSELAARAGLSPAAMTKRLDGLERAGHVTRTLDPTDRRRITVQLTTAGRAAWDRTMRDRDVREQELLAGLTPAQRDQLAGLLRRVVLTVDQPEGRGPSRE
jgi:DNA-binding MarR family transcriptional regulator